MEKHTCKLCFRRFSNGRALGGHMRSHVVSSAARPPSPSCSASSSPSLDGSSALGLGYVLRENPKKSFRVVDPEFDAGAGSSIVLQDLESDTESLRAYPVHRRGSKCPRSSIAAPEPANSASDAIAEEDVALSLMMLSRDFWSRSASVSPQSEDDDGVAPIAARSSRRSRYQCGACKKVFRSYQALGGHRASHKRDAKGCRGSASIPSHQIHKTEPSGANAGKVHECPFCFRVFASGQALGGHKRSHLASNSNTSPAAPPLGKCLIDLNLPAPTDDDVELSAVSDAEFVRRPAT